MPEMTVEMVASVQSEAFKMGVIQGANAAAKEFELRITELAGTTDYIRQYVVRLEAMVQELNMELSDANGEIGRLGGQPSRLLRVTNSLAGPVIHDVEPAGSEGPQAPYEPIDLIPGDPGYGTEHIDGKLIGGAEDDGPLF